MGADRGRLFKAVGKRIRKRRLELDVTQQRLASDVGCSRVHICNIEAGNRPGMELMMRISEALGISLTTLMQGRKPRSK